MRLFKFNVTAYKRVSEGRNGFIDNVIIIFESGDPGGEDGEFEEYMKDALRSWYNCDECELEEIQLD